MRRRAGFAGVTALLLAAAAAGCYAPNPASGTLKCGPNFSCPEGYTCAADNTCWKSSGGGSTGTGGTGGTVTPETFVNHWVFDATSTLSIMCSDNSMSTKSLKDDFVDVYGGVASDLIASYYCDWDMTVNGNKANIVANQSCSSTDMASGTQFTWYGDAFTLQTSDGKKATLQATISADYVDVDTTTGSCTLRIAGTLNATP